MSRLSEIFKGWRNYVFPNSDVEELAKERMKTCVDCEFLSRRNYCELCGCYMPAKVRSPKSRCKAKKW